MCAVPRSCASCAQSPESSGSFCQRLEVSFAIYYFVLLCIVGYILLCIAMYCWLPIVVYCYVLLVTYCCVLLTCFLWPLQCWRPVAANCSALCGARKSAAELVCGREQREDERLERRQGADKHRLRFCTDCYTDCYTDCCTDCCAYDCCADCCACCLQACRAGERRRRGVRRLRRADSLGPLPEGRHSALAHNVLYVQGVRHVVGSGERTVGLFGELAV